MSTLVQDIFHRFEARQSLFFDKLSQSGKRKLAEADNRYAELVVTGPEGGTFYFLFRGQRFHMLPEPPDVPYDSLDKMVLDGDEVNYLYGDDIFLDIVDGDLSPRAAVSRKYFRVNSDRVIYDTEELAQAFEGFLEDMRLVLGRR